MERNNIFNFATSELSQDAFICWLCNWVNFDDNDLSEDEKKLKVLATDFIEKISGEKLEDRKVNIKRQYQKIDVLLEIQNKTEFITNENEKNPVVDIPVVDIYVIIEDKVGTSLHSDQQKTYRNLILKKNKEDNGNKAEIKVVYYKIYDEDNMERLKEDGIDIIFQRKDMLALLEKYKNSFNNILVEDYYNYLNNIEKDVNSYIDKKLEDWNSNCYIGFFKELKKEESCLEHADGRKKDCSWGYVNNSSGGFMGMWWFPLKMEEVSQVTKKFQLWQNQLELNNDLYLQIEQFHKKEKEIYNKKNIIAVKYSLGDKDDEKYDEKVKISSEIRNKIYEELKENLKEKGFEFYKKRFVAGQYMTVGYLEFEDIDDCKDKIKILQYALNLLLKI